MIKNLHNSWQDILKDEFKKEYMLNLVSFLDNEKKMNKNVIPAKKDIFNALNFTPLDEVKVVILGQDPYPNASFAHGLSFSTAEGVTKLPKSLININKELLSDLNIDNSHSGYLKPWSKQGVLLLNSVLTLREGKCNSHKNIGWEIFTDKIIEIINTKCENIVFIIWGESAKKKCKNININKHCVISSPHPSPLSAYRGFFDSRCFSKCNDYLKKNNKKEINWQLP